jgi:hypothetical protein
MDSIFLKPFGMSYCQIQPRFRFTSKPKPEGEEVPVSTCAFQIARFEEQGGQTHPD